MQFPHLQYQYIGVQSFDMITFFKVKHTHPIHLIRIAFTICACFNPIKVFSSKDIRLKIVIPIKHFQIAFIVLCVMQDMFERFSYQVNAHILTSNMNMRNTLS